MRVHKMDGRDRRDDDPPFRVGYTSEGVAKLREKVTEKLKEYMGDYTDETLVEYVIVLLKNGRSKEEAKNELNVFLGDDSDPFISWLWDHLGSNLNLYVQSREAVAGGALKARPAAEEQTGKNDSHLLDPESEKAKPNKSSRPRHSRDWKGLATDGKEHPTLKSSTEDSNLRKEENHSKVDLERSSHSPRTGAQRKRSHPEEQGYNEREVVSQATMAVPRRLLQFAVRDAVAMSRPSNLTSESSLKRDAVAISTPSNLTSELSLKRLRSVVSSAADDSPIETRPQRIRSVAKVASTMPTAVKAVEEAAKDAKKLKPSRNVFDRLGRAVDISDTTNQATEFGEGFNEDGKDCSYTDLRQDLVTYRKTDDPRGQNIQWDMGMACDAGSDHEGCDFQDVSRRLVMNVSESGTSLGNKNDHSLMFPYSMTNNAGGRVQKTRKDQFQPEPVLETSRKMINTAGNMASWKSPRYLEAGGAEETNTQNFIAENKVVVAMSSNKLMKENNDLAHGNGNVKPEVVKVNDIQKMDSSTPGLSSTGPPSEDADSRTIFVNNVHFAATKDSISRHFNKFGEVLKVVILTDPSTGLPKGSAYVEFMRKEAAEHALSLDGTSFMSRILKVLKKSSAPPEAASSLPWPRAAWSFPLPASGFGRMPFPRSIPNAYRARPPFKPGARSMQWTRDAQPSPTQNSIPASNNFTSAAPRGLTYVRTEAKTNGSSRNG